MLPNNFNREHINYFSPVSIRRLVSEYEFSEVETSLIEIDLGVFGKNKFYLGMYQKLNKAQGIHKEKITDKETRKSIMEYYDRMQKRILAQEKLIRYLLESKKSVAVWGAGENLSNLLATTKLGECKIDFLVDNNRTKIGKQIEGYDVCLPEALYEFEGIIVICSMLGAESIKGQIVNMKLSDEVVVIS